MNKRERIYIALIAALSIHAAVLFFLSEVPQRRQFSIKEFTEVTLADFLNEEEEEEVLKSLEERIQDRIREDIANLVADANAEKTSERQTYVSERSRDRIAKAVEGELRELERQTFEQLAERRREKNAANDARDGTEGDEGSSPTDAPLENYDYYGKSYNGNVTAEYDLLGREARLIHIPGYKCKGGGVVKVIIGVNPAGQVIDAEIDPSQSRYDGDCLPTEALRSARMSVFFVKSDAPKRQTGSITFRFIPQ